MANNETNIQFQLNLMKQEIDALKKENEKLKKNQKNDAQLKEFISHELQNIEKKMFVRSKGIEFIDGTTRRISIGTGDFGNGEVVFHKTIAGTNLATGGMSSAVTNGVVLFSSGIPPAELFVGPGTITLELFATGSSNRINLNIDSGGLIVITSLPTSDPGVTGALWNSAGTVKVS